METRSTDSIDIPVQGASAGLVNISIVGGSSSSKKKAIITYTPDPNNIKPPPISQRLDEKEPKAEHVHQAEAARQKEVENHGKSFDSTTKMGR